MTEREWGQPPFPKLQYCTRCCMPETNEGNEFDDMGICKACTCIKTAGQVRDTRTGEISDGGEAEIQICVSVPVGTVTLDI